MLQLNTPRHADRIYAALDLPDPPFGVVASWRRCLTEHRLDPERPDPPTVLSGFELRCACGSAGRLMRAAGPELDRLHALVGAVGYSVLMSDARGAILARRVAPSDEAGCRRWSLWTGALWNEAVEGTNGVGTCLAEQRALTVHRDQHFRRRYTRLSCTVAPLFDAAGRLAGAVDISSFRPDLDGRLLPLAMAAVLEAARRIEAACFRDAFSHCLVLAMPPFGDDQPSAPLLALDADRRILGATRAARQVLRLSDASLERGTSVGEVLGTGRIDSGSLEAAERAVLSGALAQAQGNVSHAARSLGVSRATLHRRLRALGIERATSFR